MGGSISHWGDKLLLSCFTGELLMHVWVSNGLVVGSGEVLGAESSLESLWPHMEAGGYRNTPGSLSGCTGGNAFTKIYHLQFGT